MAKFSGVVGYAHNQLVRPGVYDDVIVERRLYGDVTRNTRQLRDNEKVNSDLTVQNSVSVVADAYANQHFFAIRFVEWAGVCWEVDNVEVQHPRLLLTLGGVYNGPRAVVDATP